MATFAFAGGVTAIPGWGQRDRVRFIGDWAVGDTWTLQFTSTEGDFTVGAGNLLGAAYNYLLTFGDRVYIANGAFWNASANGDPTRWEEQDVGSAKVKFRSSYGTLDAAVSFAMIQGRLAVFGRYNIQVWNVDADPNQFARVQILQNIGTIAPFSVQSIGEIDTLFLDDTGVRSLRSREVTLNAYVNDVGSPIDTLIQAALVGLTDAQKKTAIAVVEPSSKRYWLYLNGLIYVLSDFPLSKILAWTTYVPSFEKEFTPSSANYDIAGAGTITGLTVGKTYRWVKGANDTLIGIGGTNLTSSDEIVAGATTATITGTPSAAVTGKLYGQVSFTPESFKVFQGQVYIRSTVGDLLVYGGTNNNTYDGCIPIAELPWLENQDPTGVKQGQGLDAAFKGRWHILASMNPRPTSMTEVILKGSATTPDVLQDSTFDTGHYGYSASGTHFKIKAVGVATDQPAKFAKVSLLYNPANQK